MFKPENCVSTGNSCKRHSGTVEAESFEEMLDVRSGQPVQSFKTQRSVFGYTWAIEKSGRTAAFLDSYLLCSALHFGHCRGEMSALGIVSERQRGATEVPSRSCDVKSMSAFARIAWTSCSFMRFPVTNTVNVSYISITG